MSRRRFADKVAIITGGASGIGAALCRQMAAEGARVIVADIATEAAQALCSDIGGEAHGLDVTDAAAVGALVDEVVQRHGRIDYMFNVAGAAIIGEFRDMSLPQIERVVHLNLNGVLYGAYAAYRHMVAQGFGHIVNMASGYGLTPGPGNLPYVTSKFGVVGLSESLRMEGQDLGVKVTVICPGFVDTPLTQRTNSVNLDAAGYMRGLPVKMITAEQAASTTLDGVVRNRAMVVFPGYVRVLHGMYRWLPAAFYQYGLKVIRRLRKFRKG